LASALTIATGLALAAALHAEPLADFYGNAFDAWVARYRPATAVVAVQTPVIGFDMLPISDGACGSAL